MLDLAPIREAKEIEERMFKPEYEITLAYQDAFIPYLQRSPLSNNFWRDIPVILTDTINNDIILQGVVKDIQPSNDEIKLIVSINGYDGLEEKIETSVIDENPAEIIKTFCDVYGLEYDEVFYKRVKEKYNEKYYSIIADDTLTFYSALNGLSKKAGLQIYFSNNKIVFDTYDPTEKDEESFTVTDKDLLSGVKLEQNNWQDRLFTNYAFKCEDEGDVILTDNGGYNYGENIRKKYGDIPYDEQDGGVGAAVRIKDADSGHFAQRNLIKMYGREFIIASLTFDIQKYNAFRLDTIFRWVSKKFNFNKRFEVQEIQRDYSKQEIQIVAWELATDETYQVQNGYGITGWGLDYGK